MKTLAQMRQDLQKQELSIPVGNKYYIGNDLFIHKTINE